MDNSVFFNRESDTISIRINGKEYLISIFFSMVDAKLYLSQLEETQDAKKAIAFIIHKKLEKLEPPVPTIEEIANEDASEFSDYILAIVKSDDEKLYDFFKETEPTLPITERFAQAYKKYSDFLDIKMSKILKPNLDVLKWIQKSSNLSRIAQFQQIFIQQITDSIFAPIRNAIDEYNIQISSFLEKNAEDKEKLVKRYQKWGNFGWTIIPNSPINFFNSDPQNAAEAHKCALRYCTSKDMEELFSSMKERNIRKAELDETIYCYRHKQYTSCALLLFALIDAKMIHKQPQQEGKRRPVGGVAARELKNRFSDMFDEDAIFSLLFEYLNLMACLDMFFKNGDDFKQEPPVINRNFIGHGMHSRKVRKRDCIQLFLALYNLTNFLDEV